MRVALLGDPTKALGSLAEPECRRIIAALDLAESLGVPLEWFALSAGARIAMDSGTENMDWIADVLRRLIEFTQAGHEVNVVVTGINVGAQPYWNAEATMLMHTKGILVMTPDSAMVLTGKQALDYSGSVSAEDNLGIGGYERIMGPNGQGQYWAPDLPGAISVLLAHYDHTYVAPGERFPRRATTTDPADRDVREFPHHLDGSPIADGRRHLLRRRQPRAQAALRHPHRDACGRRPGPSPRSSAGPTCSAPTRSSPGTPRWAAGRWRCSASKDGRCVAAASCRPTAPTSGRRGRCSRCRRRRWPGSSTRRAATVRWSCWRTCPASTARRSRCGRCSSSSAPRSGAPSSTSDGPIVFVVVSRYHGGAFVVFSQKLNADLETIAVEGAKASVIGGAPAAAVVFAGEVAARTRADERRGRPRGEGGRRRGQRARAAAHRSGSSCRPPSAPRSSAMSLPSSI